MGHLKEVAGSHAATSGDAAVSDGVGVQSIVIGADLVLTITDDRRITLHAVTPQGNRALGTFGDVAAAWAMVDRIDLGDRGAQETAVAEARSTERLPAA